MDKTTLATILTDVLIDAKKIKKRDVNEVTGLILEKLDFYDVLDDEVKGKKRTKKKEVLSVDQGDVATSNFDLGNNSVEFEEFGGVVYRKGVAIQSFKCTDQGALIFENIGQPSDTMVISGTLDPWRGQVTLIWNTAPKENHIEVTYKYRSK